MKYFYQGRFDPKKLPKLNIDCLSVSFVPEKSRVLEIGCADGFMGEYLIKEKECQVVGVEIDKGAVKKARTRGLTVICGDIEEEKVVKKLRREKRFRVILCTSTIEHLKEPQKALKRWRELLEEKGLLIITTPNINHWSARLKTLLGKFPREDYGIFDKNHLHFYTLNSFRELVEKAGFSVEKQRIDPIGGGLPKVSKFLSLFFSSLFAYQIVISAKKREKLKEPVNRSF